MKPFRSARNYSGWPLSNISILSSYVSESADDGLLHVLILMISHLFTSYINALISGIGGVSICAYISMLRQAVFKWSFVVVYLDDIGEL